MNRGIARTNWVVDCILQTWAKIKATITNMSCELFCIFCRFCILFMCECASEHVCIKIKMKIYMHWNHMSVGKRYIFFFNCSFSVFLLLFFFIYIYCWLDFGLMNSWQWYKKNYTVNFYCRFNFALIYSGGLKYRSSITFFYVICHSDFEIETINLSNKLMQPRNYAV